MTVPPADRSAGGGDVDRSWRRAELVRGLARVRSRIADACAAAGRATSGVDLVVVTKFFPAEDAADLVRIGCRDLGESRQQEAAPKVAACARLLGEDLGEDGAAGSVAGAGGPRWHMLGRVQRNKASAVARWAHTVQSLDSERLAGALAAGAARALDDGLRARPLRVHIQVSVDGDPGRGGAGEDAAARLADTVEESGTLELAGLMAVAPLGGDPDRAFEQLAAIRQRFLMKHPSATQLSAGMSGDLESAVAHGSTCVRVGTAIMGARPILSP